MDKGLTEIVESHHVHITHTLATRKRCLHKNVGEILDLDVARRIERRPIKLAAGNQDWQRHCDVLLRRRVVLFVDPRCGAHCLTERRASGVVVIFLISPVRNVHREKRISRGSKCERRENPFMRP